MENEKSVQGTNDSSILSKCSMIKLGYFNDPLLHHFVVQKKSRRSPLINRGYYVRAKAIQFTLDTFIERFKQEFQVISLGAGFDSLFFRLAHGNNWPNNSVYCEIDFPELVQRKRCLILKCPELMKLLRLKDTDKNNEDITLESDNYKLFGIDLRDLRKLKSVLEINGISKLKPTLVLLECVRTYLDSKSSLNLIKWIAEEFQTVTLASYEQMYCDDGFGLIMLNHFSSLNSPLLSIHSTSNSDSLKHLYLNLGWENIYLTNMSYFYNSIIHIDEKERIEAIEPFDEYEEWHLKCNHYILILVSKGISEFDLPYTSNILKCNRKAFSWKFSNNFSNAVERFAHSSVLMGSQIISIGGFGIENSSHKRLTHLTVTSLFKENICSINLINEENLGARMYAQTVLLNSKNSIAVIGGRSSPVKPNENMVLLAISENGNMVANIKHCVGEKPSPRWRHSASLIVLNGIEHVIVFGGKSIDNKFLGDCFILNSNTWTWKKIKESDLSPSPRHSHSSVSWLDRVLITCGLDASYKPVNSIHALNCSNFTWSIMQVAGLIPRYSHTSHVWQNNLFLVGGVNCDPECLPGIARISLDTWHCVEYTLPILTRDKPVLLHNHSSILDTENQQIIVLGGGGNCFSFGTHFNKDVITIDVDQLCE